MIEGTFVSQFCLELYSLHSIFIDKSTYMTFTTRPWCWHETSATNPHQSAFRANALPTSYWSTQQVGFRFGVYNKGEI